MDTMTPEEQIKEMMGLMAGSTACYSRDPIEALIELLNDRERLLLITFRTSCPVCLEIISMFKKSWDIGDGRTITEEPCDHELPKIISNLIANQPKS